MQVRILGAHCYESRTTRPVSILIDGLLCIDTGSLTTALSFDEQARVRAILLTHRHFDHLKGVPTFGINTARAGVTEVFGLSAVLDDLRSHLVNGTVYPTFTEPASFGGPSLAFREVEPFREFAACGYRVLPVPVKHGVPAVGYAVAAKEGASVFYTGDTAGNLGPAWEATSPRLLIVEVTLPNAARGTAKHMCAADLERELERYRAVNGTVPPVLIVHMVPWEEGTIRREVDAVARRLGVEITLAHEDQVIEV